MVGNKQDGLPKSDGEGKDRTMQQERKGVAKRKKSLLSICQG